MKIKTLVPHFDNTYSSFPTFTEYEDRIFVFYRQGITSDYQCHGIRGKVRCFEIEKEILMNMPDGKEDSLYSYGKDYTVFENENEIDAVVSKLDDNVYSLCTRKFMKKQPVETYISFSDSPSFNDRREVNVNGIDWVVFYGKAFKWDQGHVFSAYGEIDSIKGERPMLLITDNFESWELLSYMPDNSRGTILNESSVVFDGKKYTIFMREDEEPFGIWYSTSRNLQDWTAPERLLSSAHAPMAVYENEKIYLAFRELVSNSAGAVSLMSPFAGRNILNLDKYEGNPYDGGYADISIIDNRLLAVYYFGNEIGEPYLKCCVVERDEVT